MATGDFPTHACVGSCCPICHPTCAAQPWGVYTIYPQTWTSMCNCGAMAVAANPMGYPPSHGPDCPMCPQPERWLKQRIRELESRLKELEAKAT